MAETFRLLVSGSRLANGSHEHRINLVLFDEVRLNPPVAKTVVLVHGDALGVDKIAERIAERYDWKPEPHPALWADCTDACPPSRHRKTRRDGTPYCPLAGHRRNQEMVDAGADLCVAFPARGSNGLGGTWDLIHRATDAGIEAIVHSLAVRRG